MPQTIFICQYPLPYHKIASWTTMYNQYIQEGIHAVDHLICPKLETTPVKDITYHIINNKSSLITKAGEKLQGNSRFQPYLDALDKIIVTGEKYVIKITDNSGLAIALHQFLSKNHDRSHFHILYYYQGFAPLFALGNDTDFLFSVDEVLFLTALSYLEWKRYHNELPFTARVLHNATDGKRFKILSPSKKTALKKDMFLDHQYIFTWCSQDRKKKGLHLILEVWRQLPERITSNAQLLIIGVDKEIDLPGVQVLGRVPNEDLAKYYQISDFYLFPSLWKEGFGIVLAEALKCGCYCIASDNGGIPEVLKKGQYGDIVAHPNMVNSWKIAIEKGYDNYVENDNKSPFLQAYDATLYDIENWRLEMNDIVHAAKTKLSNH